MIFGHSEAVLCGSQRIREGGSDNTLQVEVAVFMEIKVQLLFFSLELAMRLISVNYYILALIWNLSEGARALYFTTLGRQNRLCLFFILLLHL